MKTPENFTLGIGRFSPQSQALYSHFRDLWIANGWVLETNSGEITIMRDFIIDVAHDYLDAIVENDNIESLETRDLAQAALGFLRSILKPTKKGIYLNQIGSNASGSAEFKIGLLDSESDVAPSCTISNEHELFVHGLDPLLVGFGVLAFSCGRSAPKRLRLLRRTKVWIEGDPLLGKLIKLSPSLNSNKVAELARVKPYLQKNSVDSEVYSLAAKVTDTESNDHKVSVSDVNFEQGYLKSDDGTYIPFEEDLKSFWGNIRDHQVMLKDEAVEYLVEPTKLLEPGVDADKIDFSEYSDRVQGFEELSRNKIIEQSPWGIQWYSDDIGKVFLTAKTIDGEDLHLPIENPLRVSECAKKMEEKINDGDGSQAFIQFGEHFIPATEQNLKSLKEVQMLTSAKNIQKNPQTIKSSKVLVAKIKETDSISEQVSEVKFDLLSESEYAEVLISPDVLKPHQKEGISWLVSHFTNDAGGVLLADDMGLGKTLQLLTFSALIKKKYPLQVGVELKRPIIVVVPTVLLKNWDEEIDKFIKPNIFKNRLVFHRDSIKAFKGKDGNLNLDALKTYDIIITNYTSFASYQKNLLRINYGLALFDESQNIKNPHTAQTRAAHGLKSRFTVCSTGTPVENKLLDVWSQVDALGRKPSNPLGTSTNFIKNIKNNDDDVNRIRIALGYPGNRGIVLRREKTILSGFPQKHFEPVLKAEMSAEQIHLESQIISMNKKNKLKIIQQLQALYQHPILLASGDESSDARVATRKLIEDSSKLRVTLECLDKIQAKGEKVLIFALWVRMQFILQRVIKDRYGIDISIINGETNSRLGHGNSANDIIERFSKVPGFNIIILSPVAAGAGLNITSANHVIHYGRWWNPAKEEQATDRAYRIGQSRNVHVYYPISVHPSGLGFDLALHDLISKKRKLSKRFLTPVDDELSQDELEKIFMESCGAGK